MHSRNLVFPDTTTKEKALLKQMITDNDYAEARLVNEISTLMENYLPNKYRRTNTGLTVGWDWIVDILDGDEDLARSILIATGFRPSKYCPGVWVRGNGFNTFIEIAGVHTFADAVTAILDKYRPV